MKILLIDDHELVRYGIRRMLEEVAPGWQVLEAASLYRGAEIYAGEKGNIGLIVLDLNLPDARGLAGLRQFTQRHPGAPLVVLSGSVDEAIASEAIAMGAMAFLHKTSDVGELRGKFAALIDRRVAATGTAVQHASIRQWRSVDGRDVGLNARDLRILDLLLQGNTNKEIAEEMGLAIGTTKNHISGLLAAFGVTSRARLIALFH